MKKRTCPKDSNGKRSDKQKLTTIEEEVDKRLQMRIVTMGKIASQNLMQNQRLQSLKF
jgi:hypothetical protein